MDLDVRPTPEELAAEISATLRQGITTKSLTACAAVLALPVVCTKAADDTPNDLATAACNLLREIAVTVDGQRDGPVATLLGLATGTRATTLKERRRQTAELLFISPAHLRTSDREAALIESLADELYSVDSAYRLRHRHRTEPEQPPERSGLRVDWLAQHRSYRRIWTPLSGVRNDLYALRRYLAAEQENQPAIADRLCNLSWHWASYLTALTRFIEEQGGLWLLANADSEIAAADAVYRVQFYVPLGETDNSWLRTLLAETPHSELDGFGDRLIEAGERRQELMGAWVAWTGQCDKPDDDLSCTCSLHAWLQAADHFIRLIDEDWYRLADYYRASDLDASGLDIRELWESMPPKP